jgi:hypothetical protein
MWLRERAGLRWSDLPKIEARGKALKKLSEDAD